MAWGLSGDAARRGVSLDYHFYVAGAVSEAAFLHALVEGLRARGWKVFDSLAPAAPGADPAEERAAAWSRSGWYVLVQAPKGDGEARAEALRMVQARRDDPAGVRILPVRIGGQALDRRYSDLGLLQAIEAKDRDVTRVVAAVHQVAEDKGLRQWGLRRGSVAVCAVLAELGNEAEQVVQRLRRLRSQVEAVELLDLADAGSLARAQQALLRVVLLGASTGGEAGAATVRSLLEEPQRVVVGFLDALDRPRRKQYAADAEAREGLLDEAEAHQVAVAFKEPHEAAEALHAPVSARLAELLPAPAGGPVVLHPWELHYLSGQRRGWREGRPDGLRGWSERCSLDREPLYVSLLAREQGWVRVEGKITPTPREHSAPDELRHRPDREGVERVFLDELISLPELPHLVILGEAGSGKTVLLQHVAWSLACAHLGQPLPEACRLDLSALCGARALPPLPVLVEARHLAAEIVRAGASGSLERLLVRTLEGAAATEVREGLATGRYLLLIDSLDEVPSRDQRAQVVGVLQGAADQPGCQCRIVLTTRPTAHTGVQVPGSFRRAEVAALDDDRRAALVARWQEVQNLPDESRASLPSALAGLRSRFRHDGRGQSPLENPLLLTCVLLVFIEQQRLPNNLAELYERMVRHLCDRRPDSPEDADRTRQQSTTRRLEVLTQVGLALQRSGTTALTVSSLCERLVEAKLFSLVEDARLDLDQLALTTGLLRFVQEETGLVVRPWHRSFQEYLAARALAGRSGSEAELVEELAAGERPVLLDEGWEGCLRFLVGAYGQAGGARARGVVQALLDLAEQHNEPRWEGRLFGLAAAGVAEYEREHFQEAAVREELPARLAERYAANGVRWPWRDRVLALTGLGRLGDPRLPDPRGSVEGWVEVAAGVYRVGGDEKAYNPLEAQEVSIERFLLRAWPVTVAEYRVFLDSEAGAGLEQPLNWPEQVDRPNVPVVGVAWFEATAFCRWATGAWRLPEPGVVALPTSVAWEVAARGAEAAVFPWGEQAPGKGDLARAAYQWGQHAADQAVPVGAFPAGDKGRVFDLAGNVWEWTASAFGEDDKVCQEDDTADASPRVLRGGSWNGVSWDLRCATRLGLLPWDRDGYVGFRLCLRPQHDP